MRARRHCLVAAQLLTSAWLGLGCLSAIPTAAPAQEPAPADGQLAMRSDRRPAFFTVRSPDARREDARGAAPLRRRLSVDLHDVPLAAALAALSAQTGMHFVYSQEQIAVERHVSLAARDITLGAALTELLLDAGVDVELLPSGQAALVKQTLLPVAVGSIVGRVTDAKTQAALTGATVVVEGTRYSATTGNDGRYQIAAVAPGAYTVRARYIGYAPRAEPVSVSADQEATADFTMEKSAQRLDEVVTTGTVVPTEVKALPTPISVITADDIQKQNLQRVDQVFRGQVPGAVAWDQAPGNDAYSTIAMRGTSTLGGAPTIKTFIDGVEVADPQYIATIDPNSIDRIEVTRGPQASTLYGAGALSGVMQIFTKKGRLGLKRPEVSGKLSAGGIGGFDGKSTALQTDNDVSVLGGSDRASYNIGASYRHTGEWVPTYHWTDWGVSAGGQTTMGPFTLSSSARYADKTFNDPWDTRFQGYTYYSQPFYQAYRLRQQTYGATAHVAATRNWQHTLTVGYDQTYSYSNRTQPRLTTPADSFLNVVAGHFARTSLLYHTDLSVQLGTAVAAVVTGGVNYDSYDNFSSSTSGATVTTGSLDGSSFVVRAPETNTGYFGQVQVSLAERLFLTGGVRAERNPNFGVGIGTAWSPRVGAAYVLELGAARVKLRASYGESIRAPAPGQRDALQYAQYGYQYLANANLAPERQRGVDGGVEFYVGRASLGVTYYNQRAIDLIDLITVPTPPGTLLTYQYQNVSRVKNEGWEFEAQLPLGPVQLAGTYSITNSTVQALPPDYPAGGYQVGDRILTIPHTSAGATLTYSPLARTTLTASMTHIGHWIDNDWLVLYGYYYGNQPYLGSQRAYWIEYPTVTKFAVGVSQMLTRGLTAFVRAENVGNVLRYEHNNGYIPTPRSVIVGANVHY